MNNRLQTDTNALAIGYQAVDNAAFTSLVIDTRELMTAEIVLVLIALPVALASLKLVESDTQTDATTLGGDVTTVKDLADELPENADEGDLWILNLERYLQGSKARYIQLQATAGDGSATESELLALFRGSPRIPLGDGRERPSDRGEDVGKVVYIAGADEV